MTTPRYELRFANGDVFFSDKQDHHLIASANVVIDHASKTVVKDRFGSSGAESYKRLFPEQHTNQMAFTIKADVRVVQNGDDLEVHSDGKLIRTIKDDGNAQFDVWRLLHALSKIGK